ncbi:hypothetical protein ACWGIU_07360 [Streptomyces sp. NPDC054840]
MSDFAFRFISSKIHFSASVNFCSLRADPVGGMTGLAEALNL